MYIGPALMLPLEIISEIGRHIRYKRYLLVFSLVCSQWAQATRPHIFRDHCVRFSELGSFYFLIRSPRCTFRNHVRALTLSRGYCKGPFLSLYENAIWEAGELKRSITRIPPLLPGINSLQIEDFTAITEMPSRLRCAFFAAFVQVETLVLGHTAADDGILGRALNDAISSLPQLRVLEIRWERFLGDKEMQTAGGTITCNRDIELHLIQPASCLLQYIIASSLCDHIHHLSLCISHQGVRGHEEMLGGLQRLLEKIGPRLTDLSLTLDDWAASQASE
jgi:hypothetical protein